MSTFRGEVHRVLMVLPSPAPSSPGSAVPHLSPSLVLLLIVLAGGVLLVGGVRESWVRRQAQRCADREAYRRELGSPSGAASAGRAGADLPGQRLGLVLGPVGEVVAVVAVVLLVGGSRGLAQPRRRCGRAGTCAGKVDLT